MAGLVCLLGVQRASAVDNQGFPPLRSFSPALPRVSSQYFDVAADPAGPIYAGNSSGLVVFDGAHWQLVPIGPGEVAFGVAVGEDGKVGVGGLEEFGVVGPGENGMLRFVSLLPQLPPEQRSVGQVSSVVSTPEGFLFINHSYVWSWNGSQLRVVTSIAKEDRFPNLHSVGQERLFSSRDGIFRIRKDALEAVTGGDAFKDRRIDLILGARDGLLVSVRREGLFLLRNGVAEPFAPEASRWAAEHRIYAGVELPGGGFALGSILGGALLLDEDGVITEAIHSKVGLPDDFVSGMALDREQGLWIGLNSGLVRVDVASPLSVIDRRAGLTGSVYAMARHRGEIWAGAGMGLFNSSPAARVATERAAGVMQMRPVAGPPPSTWSLLSTNGGLLVGSAAGIWVLDDHGHAERIPDTEEYVGYALQPSADDPDRVWVGTDEGLALLRRTGDRWMLEGSPVALATPVRTIVETADVVWCGTDLMGIVGVELPLPRSPSEAPRLRRTGASTAANIFRIRGRLLAVDGERIYDFDADSGAMHLDPTLGTLEGNGNLLQLAQDAAGNLWATTRPVTILPPTAAGWDVTRRAIVELPALDVQQLRPESDGTMWLSADSGLYVHRGKRGASGATPPAPMLSRIVGERGEVLLAGSPRRAPPSLDLPASLRRVRVELGPLTARNGLRFETRLDPIDSDWTVPSSEPFADLTRLPAGRYTFRVRALDESGERGRETAWSFRVLPAWYEHPWAYGLWALLAVGCVRGYSRLRSRALRLRAAQLEARVAEQTVELRSTVSQLRSTQEDLEHANARLEEISQQDELTGVANRRRLAPVLASEWNRAIRTKRPISFILLDLDHFKQLNDSRGHLEGDRCLRQVADYLDSAIRRSGDLLVRYGGEEFAVLLPDTDLAGAIHLADELRRGIESLAIVYGDGSTGRVTASLGVAALLAEAGEGPEVLIEAADVALYRAKNDGRNRVRAA